MRCSAQQHTLLPSPFLSSPSILQHITQQPLAQKSPEQMKLNSAVVMAWSCRALWMPWGCFVLGGPRGNGDCRGHGHSDDILLLDLALMVATMVALFPEVTTMAAFFPHLVPHSRSRSSFLKVVEMMASRNLSRLLGWEEIREGSPLS